MLRIGWSCFTFAAFCARPLNSDSFLLILGAQWHLCVAIIHPANEDIRDVTSVRRDIVAYFFAIMYSWLQTKLTSRRASMFSAKFLHLYAAMVYGMVSLHNKNCSFITLINDVVRSSVITGHWISPSLKSLQTNQHQRPLLSTAFNL